MGFVARVQENSKFAASLCYDLLLDVAFVEWMKDLSVYGRNSAFSAASESLSEIVKRGEKGIMLLEKPDSSFSEFYCL